MVKHVRAKAETKFASHQLLHAIMNRFHNCRVPFIILRYLLLLVGINIVGNLSYDWRQHQGHHQYVGPSIVQALRFISLCTTLLLHNLWLVEFRT